MKTRIWIALPLAAALSLPVIAQNSPSTQSQEPAATQAAPAQTQPAADQQSNSGSQQADTQNPNGHQPLELQRHEGFWGKINPFARKKYVARQLGPIKDRVNELDDITAANAKGIKDVDARATAGIQQSMAKANEADSHAVEAGNRAQAAQQTAQQASTQIQTVSQVVNNLDQYKPVTDTEIIFRPGQTVLSTKAKEALDDMATPLKDQRGYIIQVQAFSAGRGQAAIANSQKLAESVVRYLVVNHEIPVYRVHELGLGNVAVKTDDGKTRRLRGGRVEISLLKNDLEQLSANGEPSQSGAAMQGGVSGTAAQDQQSAPATATTPAQQPAAAQPAAPAKEKPQTPVIPHS